MSAVFSDLISMAKEQAEPQRLLFLFAKPESSKSKNNKISRGHLAPIMCVDKLPDEIESFEKFSREADSIEKSWQFIFVAGLSGQNGEAHSYTHMCAVRGTACGNPPAASPAG